MTISRDDEPTDPPPGGTAFPLPGPLRRAWLDGAIRVFLGIR
jgi:hypothetical protein